MSAGNESGFDITSQGRISDARIFVRALVRAVKSIREMPLEQYGADNFLAAWAVREDAEKLACEALDAALDLYCARRHPDRCSDPAAPRSPERREAAAGAQ